MSERALWSRRGLLRAAGAGALGALAAPAVRAADEPYQATGNLKQSICRWCYGKIPLKTLAAEAARCAGDQSKYWEMHTALFAAPSEWDTTAAAASAAFAGYARQIGLNPAGFGACMTERRYAARVTANLAQGRHLGLTGTPSFIVDGKLLAGEYPFSVYQTAFDHELETIAGDR